MPNNPVRHKRGFVKIASASIKAKRGDLISSIQINNRAFSAAGQELGSPNGGPGPTYAGSGNTKYYGSSPVNPYLP